MKYDVTIQVIMTKIIRVDGVNEDDAIEAANSLFVVRCDDHPEKYEQSVLACKPVDNN